MVSTRGDESRPTLTFAILGWPDDGPTLRLDYRAFSYAGKFAMSNTGTAVLRTVDGRDPAPHWTPDRDLPDSVDPASFTRDVAAAVAFNADRTSPETLWLRYITVHVALRGDGLGPRLVRGLLKPAADRGFSRVRIAVNNPFAYEALYKSGFAFTGRETGFAELVLERPVTSSEPRGADQGTYQDGLDRYRGRGLAKLSDAEQAFLAAREGAAPPATTDGGPE